MTEPQEVRAVRAVRAIVRAVRAGPADTGRQFDQSDDTAALRNRCYNDGVISA